LFDGAVTTSIENACRVGIIGIFLPGFACTRAAGDYRAIPGDQKSK
jgi:hypothetical protein